jgi:hypothetical protein
MKRHYRQYTDDDVISNSTKVKSIAGLLKTLSLKATGGNYSNMKRILQRLKVNTSHWTGQGWSSGEQLKDWAEYTKSAHVKPHLLRERGHKCENKKCGLTHWQGNIIPLEIHHIDGNRTNNEYKNLQLLCCNCHALTPSWKKQKSVAQ